MIFSRWHYSASFWFFLAVLPLATFENLHFLPFSVYARVLLMPSLMLLEGVSGALELQVALLPLVLALGALGW